MTAVWPDRAETHAIPQGGIEAKYVYIPRKDLALTPEEEARYGVRKGEPGTVEHRRLR